MIHANTPFTFSHPIFSPSVSDPQLQNSGNTSGKKVTGFDRAARGPMGMGYGLHHDGKDSKEGVRRVEKPVLRFRLTEGEETEEFHLK